MDKKSVLWALHCPKNEVPDDILADYPDLQMVNDQIKFVSESMSINENMAQIEGKTFDIRDFPMDDRIAQREFVSVEGITLKGIEDVRVGRKDWEVFYATEMIVIGIYKRLKGVLSEEHNPYKDRHYSSLRNGDIVTYEGKETTVGWHAGSYMMKYDVKLKPLLPSKIEFQLRLF